MKHRNLTRHRLRRTFWYWLAASGFVMFAVLGSLAYVLTRPSPVPNPIAGKLLYHDADRPIVELANSYRDQQQINEANQIDKIASQPNTTWLVGPNAADPTAERDINLVSRTSAEAAAEKRLPVYELYAIPGRDACAGYSAAGFQTEQAYLAWIDRLIAALKSQAVFSVEADAIAQTVRGSCLSETEIKSRYNLIRQAVAKLQAAPYPTTVYIDAGHPEWFPDPAVLVRPLQAAGVGQARGVAVNVSFYEETNTSVAWAQRLLKLLGDDKGAIIDTSRNGRGAPAQSITGEARWCNAAGRGLGAKPTTQTGQPSIDAYLWLKNPGESDGNCFGNPPAGTLSAQLALGLARNARY